MDATAWPLQEYKRPHSSQVGAYLGNSDSNCHCEEENWDITVSGDEVGCDVARQS